MDSSTSVKTLAINEVSSIRPDSSLPVADVGVAQRYLAQQSQCPSAPMGSTVGFVCSQCGKRLPTSHGLKIHMTKLHPGWSVPSVMSLVGVPAAHAPASSSSEDQVSALADRMGMQEWARWLAEQRGSVKILYHIPKGARIAVAEAFADCVNQCVSSNDEGTWKRLFSFTVSCLRKPEEGKSSNINLTTAVKRNTAVFRSRAAVPIGATQCQRRKTVGQRKRSPRDDESKLGALVEAKIADGDVRGAVRILGSEDSMAQFDADTLKALEELHPPHVVPIVWPEVVGTGPPLREFPVTEELIKTCVASFPQGSAGGLDFLRPQHIKEMISKHTGVAGQRVLSSLMGLCKIMLRGEVPPSVCPILYGASLCALQKKGGGVRPIAVGNTLRRIVAKIGGHCVRDRLSSQLCPTQLGFGVPGGAEAAAHSARRFLAHHTSEEKIFLKLDFTNAFNTVNRDSLLQGASSMLPELVPFLSQCYRNPSCLFFGDQVIMSQRGIQQGDPLGPALFCAVIHPLASMIRSEFNCWFLDDGALGGDPDTVLSDLQMIAREAAKIGLQLNYKKCEVFSLDPNHSNSVQTESLFSEAAPGISFPDRSHCFLLGAPLTDEAIFEALADKTSALRIISSRLKILKAQVGFFILKNSVAIPKLAYVMRCAPTWLDSEGLRTFDETLKEAVEVVTNSVLQAEAWEQSTLPVKLGGLGIRQTKHMALPAFLASSASVGELMKAILPEEISQSPDLVRLEAIERWEQSASQLATSLPEQSSQKAWEEPLVGISRSALFERAIKLQDKARLLGVSSSASGAFLNALPAAPLGTLLEDNSFRIAVGLRLGSKLVQAHTCVCGKPVDEFGLHGLSCTKSAGRWSRHSAVNDLIKRSLVSAGYPSSLEPAGLTNDSNLRPDGITLIPWSRGRALAWDFTCVDSQAKSYISSSSETPLYAATEAESSKRRKYGFLEESHCFAPIAVECLGSFSKSSEKLLTEIGRRLVAVSGEKLAGQYLLQRLSIAIQRGNAASIMGTMPKGSSLDEVMDQL